MTYEALWLRAFVLTCAIEIPVYTAVLWRPWGGARRLASLLLLGFALQLATHPALWFLAPRFEPYATWVVVMELLVWAVEGGLVALALGGRPRPRVALGWGLLASFAANLTSTLIGLAVH